MQRADSTETTTESTPSESRALLRALLCFISVAMSTTPYESGWLVREEEFLSRITRHCQSWGCWSRRGETIVVYHRENIIVRK